MRSIIFVAMLSGLWVGVSLGGELPDGSATIRASIESEAGAVHVSLEGQLSAVEPLVRLLEIPRGAENLRVTGNQSATSNGVQVKLGRPMIMRGQPLLPIIVSKAPEGDGSAVESSDRRDGPGAQH